MLEEADTKGGKYGCDFSTSQDRKLPEDARRTTRNDERPSISYHFFPFSLSLSLSLSANVARRERSRMTPKAEDYPAPAFDKK